MMRLLTCSSLLIAGVLLLGCDPRIENNPLDRGRPPGLVGAVGGPSVAEGDWEPARAPSPSPGMPGAGSGAAPGLPEGSGRTGDIAAYPPGVATGTGVGLPTNGPGLYEKLCFRCHGADGRGGPMGAMLKPLGNLSDPATHARLNDDLLGRLIVHGKGKMPAFGPSITPDQLAALIPYVRTLKAE